jgi:hypothetical protein
MRSSKWKTTAPSVYSTPPVTSSARPSIGMALMSGCRMNTASQPSPR